MSLGKSINPCNSSCTLRYLNTPVVLKSVSSPSITKSYFPETEYLPTFLFTRCSK